ncbi:MAG: hypothetical protein M3R52_01410 [Acidobacteriota bacterium]|nr:hypothetical protein [Acidobacteriota bacterium]
MKTLKAICTAAILALTLSVSAYGGEVSTPGYTEPPPPPPPQLTTTVAPSGLMATSSELDDINSPSFADILWVLASIF